MSWLVNKLYIGMEVSSEVPWNVAPTIVVFVFLMKAHGVFRLDIDWIMDLYDWSSYQLYSIYLNGL